MDYEKTPGGITNFTSSFIPPKTGESGHHICRSCGHNFNHKEKSIFFDLFRNPFVRCPKCCSLRTDRDSKWHY